MAARSQKIAIYFHFTHEKRQTKNLAEHWFYKAFEVRRVRDSNPCGVAPKWFSRPPRYDHFANPPRYSCENMGILPSYRHKRQRFSRNPNIRSSLEQPQGVADLLCLVSPTSRRLAFVESCMDNLGTTFSNKIERPNNIAQRIMMKQVTSPRILPILRHFNDLLIPSN